MTNSSNSTTMNCYCRERGIACFWANSYGNCELTECIRWYEFALKEMGIAPKGE